MNDNERNVILRALEAAYDTLKQPSSDYLDQSDFEVDREDAVEKLLRAMKVMELDPGRVPTGLIIPSSNSAADDLSGQPGDFIVESTTFHVTMAPMPGHFSGRLRGPARR